MLKLIIKIYKTNNEIFNKINIKNNNVNIFKNVE